MFGRPKRNVAKEVGLFVLTFAAGALTGAAIALLYTPKTGRQMRRQLESELGDIAEKVREKVEEGTDQAVGGLKVAAESIDKVVRKVARA